MDRDISKNFRIGVGYNFTEFSDDLTNFDYDHAAASSTWWAAIEDSRDGV